MNSKSNSKFSFYNSVARSRNYLNYFTLILLIVVSLLLIKLQLSNVQPSKIRKQVLSIRPTTNHHTPLQKPMSTFYHSKIRIGVVSCGNTDSTFSPDSKGVNEVLTLIKSVMISARVYLVKTIMFHFFTDNNQLEAYLKNRISEYNQAMDGTVSIEANYHCVYRSVPKSFVKDFVLSDLPCTYVRLLLPDVLTTADEILYLDTDVIITGNIQEIWNTFRDMNNKEIATLVPNNELEDTNYGSIDTGNFGNIPHVPPKGVNAGIMFMNLSKMRELNWTSVIQEVYRAYIHHQYYMNDQRLLNIIFHNSLDKLKILPCQYNFQYLHCEKGLTCQHALDDPTGIQLLHGAGNSFENSSKSHYFIYESYKNFDLKKHDTVIETLWSMLKEYYTKNINSSTCNGLMGPLIFKNIEDNE